MPETQARPPGEPRAAILDRIVASKLRELDSLRARAGDLERALPHAPPVRAFAPALRRTDGVALIAEVKRRSPGAGPIRDPLDPGSLAAAYAAAGAAAVSVLTDREHFGGSLEDLRAARDSASIPVLRKDFTLDPLHLLEARAAGADAVLLIMRLLDDATLVGLLSHAHRLGMEALVEVHDAGELDRAVDAGARVVGINNRDLGTFRTRLDVTFGLLDRVPAGVTVVSESGIRTREEVVRLGRAGVHAVLVGESLLRSPDPARAAAELAGGPAAGRGPDA